MDGSVVLVSIRVPGVHEARSVELPLDARTPGSWGSARRATTRRSTGPLAAASSRCRPRSRRTPRANRRARRGTSRPTVAARRIPPPDRPTRCNRRRRIVQRTHDESRLLRPSLSFEHEHPVAADLHCLHHRQAHQRDKSLVPYPTFGDGIERRSGVPVLFGHPVLHLRIVPRLQPAVGVGDGDPVQRVDHRLTSSAWWRHTKWSAAAHVGALAVVRLAATHARLALLGLLRHGRSSLWVRVVRTNRGRPVSVTRGDPVVPDPFPLDIAHVRVARDATRTRPESWPHLAAEPRQGSCSATACGRHRRSAGSATARRRPRPPSGGARSRPRRSRVGPPGPFPVDDDRADR